MFDDQVLFLFNLGILCEEIIKVRTFLGKNKDGGCLRIETGEDSMKISPKKKSQHSSKFSFPLFSILLSTDTKELCRG